ncbi:MAG: hypothetical protein WAK82_39080, partial [Streptosporangiaceae bacterium]
TWTTHSGTSPTWPRRIPAVPDAPAPASSPGPEEMAVRPIEPVSRVLADVKAGGLDPDNL